MQYRCRAERLPVLFMLADKLPCDMYRGEASKIYWLWRLLHP